MSVYFPGTQSTSAYPLHPTAYALPPTPYALHPTPYAVRRPPYPLSPTPYLYSRYREHLGLPHHVKHYCDRIGCIIIITLGYIPIYDVHYILYVYHHHHHTRLHDHHHVASHDHHHHTRRGYVGTRHAQPVHKGMKG